MFEKFTSGGQADFQQRYLNTYGFFRTNGKKILSRIRQVGPKEIQFYTKDGATYTLLVDHGDEVGFEFITPRASWYNTAQGVPLLVRRVAARQYSRGICEKNTSIHSLNGQAPVNFETLEQIFDSHVSFLAAYKAAMRDKPAGAGVALSKAFVLDLNRKRVYAFENEIGTYSYKEGLYSVQLYNPLFSIEVVDAFKRNNMKVELV
jgi:hypothetical protein